MVKNTKKMNKILLIQLIILALLFPLGLDAKGKRKDKNPKKDVKKVEGTIKKTEVKSLDGNETQPSKGFLQKWKFHTALLVNFSNPASSPLNEVYDLGLGVTLLASVDFTKFLPFKFMDSRAGLHLGFTSYPSKITGENFKATSTHVPILLFYEMSKEIEKLKNFSFRPFLRLAGGATRVSANTSRINAASTSGSSFDGSLMASAGTGFIYKKIKSIEFNIGVNYLMIFEELGANFFSFHLGCNYRF